MLITPRHSRCDVHVPHAVRRNQHKMHILPSWKFSSKFAQIMNISVDTRPDALLAQSNHVTKCSSGCSKFHSCHTNTNAGFTTTRAPCARFPSRVVLSFEIISLQMSPSRGLYQLERNSGAFKDTLNAGEFNRNRLVLLH